MFPCFRAELAAGRDRIGANAAAVSAPDAEAGATTTQRARTWHAGAAGTRTFRACTSRTPGTPST